MASLAHPSATASNYHLQSVPRICNLKMNPLSNTNYSRSLAAIALANHSAALNQLSALNSASSSLSSHTAAAVADLSGSVSGSGSGCGAGGDVRMLMREAMDVPLTSSPLGSPGTAPWFAGANPGSGGYFSPDLRSVGGGAGGGGGFQAGSMEMALKKLGDCGRMGSDFHAALPHQQHSLSSVQQQHQQQQQRLRSSDSNVTRFGSLQQQQQQQQLHQEASRNDWATGGSSIHGQQQCTDANLSFASSMAAALVPSSGRGSLAARAVLLGGASNMQRQQQESYSRAGSGDGDSLSARIMRAIGEGSTQQQQQQVLGGDDSSMLQEMMGCGSYNVTPPSNAAQHFLTSGRPMAMPAMPMQGSMEADWTSLLMDAAAADVSVSLQPSLPKPSPASLHFIPDSTFPDTKMLYHGGAGTGAGAGQAGGGRGGGGGGDGQLEDGAAFLDAASGKHASTAMNFGPPAALDPAMAQLQAELPGGGARSPLHSPSFGTKTTSLQNLGSSSSNTKGEAGARADNLALSSDAPRMWAPGPRKDGGVPKQPPGLARTMSVNSRGNSPGELEMEQCSSMSAMLEPELPLSEKRFGKSGRRLSRTSSPSVSTMMDLAALEHGTGNSSASTSASERGDAEEKKNLGEPVPEASGSGLTMAGKGKAVVGGNGSEGAEVGGDDSSCSKQAMKENSGDSQGKKRKGRGREDGPAGKTSVTSASTAAKDSKNEEGVDDATRAKRCKASASEPDAGRGKAGGVKLEKTASDNSADSAGGPSTHASKPPEAPKPDYIHVRARRGQATDSHSLAERVRREKISERMKFLQDLVPGCSKVTGKAMMLDEIINYVQSLQRQVEYLSMKLASVNPRMDFGGVESLLSKEQSRGFAQGGQQQLMIGSEPITIPSSAYPQLHPQQQAIAMQQLAVTCGLDMRALGTQLDTVAGGLRRPLLSPASTSSITMAHSARDPFEDSVSQVSAVWDGELHSVVQMGFAQNRLSALASPSLRGSLPPGNMKLER